MYLIKNRIKMLDRLLEEKAIVREIAAGAKMVDFKVDGALIEKDILFMKYDIMNKGGIVQLLKPSDKEEDGIRNIDSARLSGGEAFLVSKIVISRAPFKTDGDSGDNLRSAKYFAYRNSNAGKSALTGSSDVSFENSQLTIKINSQQKFKGIIKNIMNNGPFHDVVGQGKSGYNIPPFLIPPNQQILPELNIFDTIKNVENSGYGIEIALIGYRITKNL